MSVTKNDIPYGIDPVESLYINNIEDFINISMKRNKNRIVENSLPKEKEEISISGQKQERENLDVNKNSHLINSYLHPDPYVSVTTKSGAIVSEAIVKSKTSYISNLDNLKALKDQYEINIEEKLPPKKFNNPKKLIKKYVYSPLSAEKEEKKVELNPDEELIVNIEELADELTSEKLKDPNNTLEYHILLDNYKKLILKHERRNKE